MKSKVRTPADLVDIPVRMRIRQSFMIDKEKSDWLRKQHNEKSASYSDMINEAIRLYIELSSEN